MTQEQVAKMFGCSVDQLKNQYSENAKVLVKMRDKAIKTGKNVNNYTASDLTKHSETYTKLAK